MNKSEILELLELRGWTRERLAVEMSVSVAAIHKWVREGEGPDGPASVLMRIWLRESRGEITIIENDLPPPRRTQIVPNGKHPAKRRAVAV